jgi:hypothetical protein
MKKLDKSPVDFDHEVAAITDFLSTRWNVLPNMEALVRAAALLGWKAGRAWIDRNALNSSTLLRMRHRESFLKQHLPSAHAEQARWYDAGCRYLDELPRMVEELSEVGLHLDGQWDFERRTKRAFWSLADEFPGLSELKPLGWEKLYESYTDFDGMEEYCETQQASDENEFKGSCVSGAVSAPFPGRVALPYVMYDEVCQGRSAAMTLVSAIYAHFLGLREHQNSCEVNAALEALDLGDRRPEVVFELKPSSPHPLNQLLLEMARTRVDSTSAAEMQQQYAQSCACAEAFEKLSPQEQEAQREANQAENLESILADVENSQSDFNRRWTAEKETRKALAKASLATLVD